MMKRCPGAFMQVLQSRHLSLVVAVGRQRVGHLLHHTSTLSGVSGWPQRVSELEVKHVCWVGHRHKDVGPLVCFGLADVVVQQVWSTLE